MENLRRRTPFISKEDETDKDDRIVMDEQEQEEVINKIRKDVQSSNERLRCALRAFLLLSALIQTASFFTPSVFIDGKPISGARGLIFLDITIHSILFPVLQGWNHHHATGTTWIFHIPTWTAVLSAFPPVMSALSGRTWLQTMWWSITLLLVMIVLLATRWITLAELHIVELEKLKYEAKGA